MYIGQSSLTHHTLTILLASCDKNLNQLLIIIAYTWIYFNTTETVIEVTHRLWFESSRQTRRENILQESSFKKSFKKPVYISHTSHNHKIQLYFTNIIRIPSLKILVVWKRDATRYLVFTKTVAVDFSTGKPKTQKSFASRY